MPSTGQESWTDDKIESTVTPHYIYSHLRADEAEKLRDPTTDESSQDSYLQRILKKCKRLFLALVDAGVPEQIFRLIDEFYDDDYLPFSEDEIASLRLPRKRTQDVEQLFYRLQYKYLIRVLREGEHIRYGQVEYVPIHTVDLKPATNADGIIDKVKLPSPVNQVFMRQRIHLPDNQAEYDLMSEIAVAKPLSHEHVLSIFGSYSQDSDMHVLMQPASKYSLKSFLSDPPKVFEALSKPERRNHLIVWPHCLSNALAWLHLQSAHHGAVRPSRIFIDEQFQISLGHFEGDWLLGSPTAKDDLESYQYAAPELWKRGLTVQSNGATKPNYALGGRSASTRQNAQSRMSDGRKTSIDNYADKNGKSAPEGRAYAFVPTFKGNSSRLKLGLLSRLPNDFEPPERTFEARPRHRKDYAPEVNKSHQNFYRRFDTLSLRSSNSSDGGGKSEPNPSTFHYSMSAETRSAVVQAWKSSAHDMAAVDVFGLAAVMMDILTVFCGRTISSFNKHRATKHRQAGRGGGMSDASFHANLTTVVSWAETLHKDADKKMKKEGGNVFCTVGPTLQLTLQCLERDPSHRMKAVTLSGRLQNHLSEFADIKSTHCGLKFPEDLTVLEDSTKKRPESQVYRAEMPTIFNEKTTYPPRFDSKVTSREAQPAPEQTYDDMYEIVEYPPPSSPSSKRTTSRSIERDGEVIMLDQYDHEEPERMRSRHVRVHSLKKNQRRLQRLIIADDDEIESIAPSTTPSMATTANETVYYNFSEPSTPATTRSVYSLFPVDGGSDYKPPDRELPAIPKLSKTTGKSKRPSTSRQAPNNVNDATHLLAETVGRLDREKEHARRNVLQSYGLPGVILEEESEGIIRYHEPYPRTVPSPEHSSLHMR